MKITYRGYELSAKREEALGGWENLYYYVMRKSDRWFAIDNFTEGEDTEQTYIDLLKGVVDEELAKPRRERWADYA